MALHSHHSSLLGVRDTNNGGAKGDGSFEDDVFAEDEKTAKYASKDIMTTIVSTTDNITENEDITWGTLENATQGVFDYGNNILTRTEDISKPFSCIFCNRQFSVSYVKKKLRRRSRKRHLSKHGVSHKHSKKISICKNTSSTALLIALHLVPDTSSMGGNSIKGEKNSNIGAAIDDTSSLDVNVEDANTVECASKNRVELINGTPGTSREGGGPSGHSTTIFSRCVSDHGNGNPIIIKDTGKSSVEEGNGSGFTKTKYMHTFHASPVENPKNFKHKDPVVCYLCGKNFLNKHFLKFHNTQKHQYYKLKSCKNYEDILKRKFVRTCTQPTTVVSRNKSSANNKLFSCKLCDRKFSITYIMKVHKRQSHKHHLTSQCNPVKSYAHFSVCNSTYETAIFIRRLSNSSLLGVEESGNGAIKNYTSVDNIFMNNGSTAEYVPEISMKFISDAASTSMEVEGYGDDSSINIEGTSELLVEEGNGKRATGTKLVEVDPSTPSTSRSEEHLAASAPAVPLLEGEVTPQGILCYNRDPVMRIANSVNVPEPVQGMLKIQCDYCSKLLDRSYYNRHLSEHCKVDDREHKSDTINPYFICYVCYEKFFQRCDYNIHIGKHIEEMIGIQVVQSSQYENYFTENRSIQEDYILDDKDK